MHLDEVKQRFVELLRGAGGDPDRLTPTPAWEAFKAFAQEPIEGLEPADDVDRLLFEVTRSRRTDEGPPTIHIDIERQYTMESDGEYEGMRHLLCAFKYALPDSNASVRGEELWSASGPLATEWAAQVEASEYFEFLRDPPTSAVLVAGDV